MKKKLTKKKTKPLSYYKKKLDKLFSEYIRRKDADEDGYNHCYTCGARHHWKTLQNGHYVRRSAGLSVYFLEENCRPQCFACNIWKQGATDEYALRLQKECGEDILQRLNLKKQEIVKYYVGDYERLIEEYTEKIRLLDAQN